MKIGFLCEKFIVSRSDFDLYSNFKLILKVIAMRKVLVMLMLATVALVPMSCKKIIKNLADSAIESTTGVEMGSTESLEKAAEAVAKIDTTQYRIKDLRISAKGIDDECSNVLGSIYMFIINDRDEVYSQHFYPTVDAPDPYNGLSRNKYTDFKTFSFDPKKFEGYIAECKAMIPKEYKFLCLNYITVENDGSAKITIHVQEIGKEKVESAGVSTEVYYVLKFEISPSGKIKMEMK